MNECKIIICVNKCTAVHPVSDKAVFFSVNQLCVLWDLQVDDNTEWWNVVSTDEEIFMRTNTWAI